MTIRLATKADRNRLVEMSARFLLESRYGKDFDNLTTPELLGTLVDNVLHIGAILVVEIGTLIEGEFGPETGPTRLVGMLAIVALPHPLTGKKCAEEIAWWVEPEHRHGALGPKLLRSAEEWATSNGANMVKFVAPAGSTVGTFYEHVGYEAVETAYIKRI